MTKTKLSSKTGEILKKIFSSESGLSSKRIAGFACLTFAMLLTVYTVMVSSIAIFANMGHIEAESALLVTINIHDSVLYAILQFLAAGTSLLGVTLLEKKGKPKVKE